MVANKQTLSKHKKVCNCNVFLSLLHILESALYSLNSQIQQKVGDTKYLGIIVDNKLTLSEHVNKITRQTYNIFDLTTRTDRNFLISALFLTMLEYSIII